MLGHRHLGDCFVRPDGSGLEAHALGCGVCLGETAQVIEAIDAGVADPVEIREAVVSTWGGVDGDYLTLGVTGDFG